MTRTINILFALIMTVTLVSGCAKKEIKNSDAKGELIICFGDSLTFGYGANPGEDYPSIMSKMTDIPLVNAGVDGDTTFMALERLEQDVLSKNPRLVIVEFCGNDFIKKIPQADTVNNLAQMIDRIHNKGAMVALVDISAGFFMLEYRWAYRKLAAEKQVIFIPSVLQGVLTNPSLKSDFLHPNASGYKIIAERIYQAIKPYLAVTDQASR